MKILIATSEVAPFSKTGGLADVCGSLPLALRKLGHEPIVISPAYRQVFRTAAAIQPTNLVFDVPMGSKVVSGRLLESHLPASDVPVYFVDQPGYFDRDELYLEDGEDFRDNCERYIFFSRAVLEAVRLLDQPIDVLHCNDWQTGLVPAYLRIEYEHARGYDQLVSLMTIHNMAYQGQFWHWDMLLTGLDWKYFNWRQMEFWGKLNLMKTGLVFADAINTVSRQYSREICEEPLGCGLAGVLQQRRDHLYGIINGVDYRIWNPEDDSYLPVNYGLDDWQEGKRACKAALQSDLNLPQSPHTPLIGMVGRLADQKGWDLIVEVMQRWVDEVDAQWVILGAGEPKYNQLLKRLANTNAHRIAARLEFSDRLAHQIEAGADIFLMPSRYEPCGLNQLYSLRYGTVPIVHATGGLADTIRDASPANLAAGKATGFSFHEYSSAALEDTLRRATALYAQQPHVWRQLVETGMRQDWSWEQSAQQYVEVYQRMLAVRQQQQRALPSSSS